MSRHLTVRMAWHDNNWDGKVCQNPSANTYCTGAHSLLSGRIEKRKDLDLEEKHKGQLVSQHFEAKNVPPCYWSINAFGSKSFNVEHAHGFAHIKQRIPELVKPYSVFTWPFKLSFVHSNRNKALHGNYPPDLEQKVNAFINGFTPKKSIIFFYANYDNPVSADEMKYLLLGASVISELPEPKYFSFSDEELSEIKKPKIKRNGKKDISMKNFPTMNWAIQFTHNPDKSVLLPYKEYVKHVDDNPEEESLLNDMKVVIEEESLVSSFKYVAMDIDDDKCLYLLYKLRKSILKIQDHNQSVVNNDLEMELERISEMIKMTWENRGIYPSLNKVLNCFMDNESLSNTIANKINSVVNSKYDLLQLFNELKDEQIPESLEDIEDDLLDLIDQRLFKKHIKSLAVLALYNLTDYQVRKLISNQELLKQLGDNPYALYEEYEADENDLDEFLLQDEPIDVYKIDVAIIPDRKYVKRHRQLQNLGEDSPKRIRSVIINYLWTIGEQGHCYDHSYNIINEIKENPLVYKNNINIDEQGILDLDTDYKSHFIEKLHIIKGDDTQDYFYLSPIKKAEEKLKETINKLVDRPDHDRDILDFKDHIKNSLDILKHIIISPTDIKQFEEERIKLYKNVFKKSFFLLTGKPGAGKTYETSMVINQLDSLNEQVVILGPTGKSALRLTENIKQNTGNNKLEAITIDKFIFEKGFGWAYQDHERLEQLPENEKLVIDNLVIDESSMIDLLKFKILLSIIRVDKDYPKRMILVGDENQLPPIGFGKPFHDVINYIINKTKLYENHYINLVSNCRQENDNTILQLAEAFTNKTRYYEESLNLLEKTGWVSDGLYIDKWNNSQSLNTKINSTLSELFKKEAIEYESNTEKLNTLFGLYDNGYVPNQKNEDGEYTWRSNLSIDNFQLLSPYRAGYFGALGLNKLMQSTYRSKPKFSSENSPFYHSDKLIRLYNWYKGRGENRRLELSNGSVGIITGEGSKRKYYFSDLEKPLSWVDNEDNFDLAYAITVHKSQGSDFKNVFLVVPKKLSLLSRELIYTALTRSKYRLFLFVEDADEESVLDKARNISHVSNRNTSVFNLPSDSKKILIPQEGHEPVRSRIEYIIYRALIKHGLKFSYEKKLRLKNGKYDIKPDFTIHLKNKNNIYWEHLGMLDVRKYYNSWQKRKQDYKSIGQFNNLITTDDLGGIDESKIDRLIEDIKNDSLIEDASNRFSNHHYELY